MPSLFHQRQIKLCKETHNYFAAIFRCCVLFSVFRWNEDSLREGSIHLCVVGF